MPQVSINIANRIYELACGEGEEQRVHELASYVDEKVSVLRKQLPPGTAEVKLLVFAAAFFPQFIAPSAPWAPQFVVLVATFLAVESLFYTLYSLSGRKFAPHLLQGAWLRRFNRASGTIFIGFGAALLRYRP